MPSSKDLPHPGMKPASLVSPAVAGGFFTTGATWEAAAPYFMAFHSYVNIKIQKKKNKILDLETFMSLGR